MKQTRRQSGGASRIVRRPGESIPGSISTTHRKTKSRLAVPDSAMPSNRGNSAAAASSPVVLNEHSPIASESDFLSLVFEFLPYQQILGRCSAVCRAWSQISTSKIEEWKLLETKAHAVRGLKGRSAGKLRGPSGLTVLPDGTLSVVDFLNHRIQLVSARSASLPTSGSIRADHVEATLVEGHLQGPTGVVPDGKGALIVGDKQGHCIYRLALPGYRPKKIGADGPPTPISAGTILARVGNHGREKDELWDPEGLAIDDDGLIYGKRAPTRADFLPPCVLVCVCVCSRVSGRRFSGSLGLTPSFVARVPRACGLAQLPTRATIASWFTSYQTTASRGCARSARWASATDSCRVPSVCVWLRRASVDSCTSQTRSATASRASAAWATS